MKWKKVDPAQVEKMKFQSNTRTRASAYDELIAEVKTGAIVQVDVEEGKDAANLKWRLNKIFKKAAVEATIDILEDKSGVVIRQVVSQ